MPFVKGQSGNPNGRPKEENSITSMLRKYGKQKIDRDGVKLTREQAIALDMWEEALIDKNQRVREYLVDRLEGKPVQRNENKDVSPPKIIKVGIDGLDTEDMEALE